MLVRDAHFKVMYSWRKQHYDIFDTAVLGTVIETGIVSIVATMLYM